MQSEGRNDAKIKGTTEEALRILAFIIAEAHFKKCEAKARNNRSEKGKAHDHKKRA